MGVPIKRKKRKKKPIQIGFGFYLFSIMFVYMLIRIIMSVNNVDTGVFQVEESSYDTDFKKTGIILRNEKLKTSTSSGYVCYYIRNGEKVSKNSNVYSIDETGSMHDALYEAQNGDGYSLSETEKKDITDQITMFKAGFSESSFSDVYDFKNNLDNKVLEIYEDMALAQLSSDNSFDSTFAAVKSDINGIVTYFEDGFEDTTVNDLTSESFDKTVYEKKSLKTGEIIGVGEPVYKIIDGEDWQIVVELTDDEYTKIESYENDTLRFTIDDSAKKYRASYDLVSNDNGKFVVLNMTRYLAQYVSDRYVNVSFSFSETKGLKIPNSSILTKQVYMIPKSYLTAGKGDTDEIYFNQKVMTDTGEITSKLISPTIYYTDDDYCYVNPDDMDTDAVLIENDTNDTFAVTTCQRYDMPGVYCVTQGTASFRRIVVTVNGDDYSIIEEGTAHGIAAYDRIVLDYKTVVENQVIY